ncbi:MAG: drug/metabolite transporter (DMT)-like permease [Gammaproteobacteria bacterium]|jgi:drug/metabolite transporter (DMT)-like permease
MKVSLFSHPKSDQPFAALLLVLTATFALAFQDSLVKLMSSDTSFWQFQTLRSFSNLSFVILLAMVSGGISLLVPKNWKAVFLRSLFLLVCMFFFFAGAPFLTVAQMAAGLYTYPLFVSLLAGPVLGEKVGIWRYGALALGAMGSSLVLSPWSSEFSTVQLLPIIAGFFYAANILTIRKACRNESPLALAFAAGLGFLIVGLIGIAVLTIFPLSSNIRDAMPFVAIGWPELTLIIVGFAILSSVLNLTGNICISRAYQTADASWLAPMDYSYLIFAAIWSRVIFDRWPNEQALIGMAMIGLAGGVTAWRENVASK